MVGWDQVLNVPWHLLDIEPYRERQLRSDSHKHVLRMPTPLAMGDRQPYFGITYFSSYGCPEPCTFCCSPQVTDRRWKAMPGERMLDDLCELHARWGFDAVRFHDANWGVMEKRSRDFAEGLLARGRARSTGTPSSRRTRSCTTSRRRSTGWRRRASTSAEIGAEAGDDDMMRKIGKHTADDNYHAAVEMDRAASDAGDLHHRLSG